VLFCLCGTTLVHWTDANAMQCNPGATGLAVNCEAPRSRHLTRVRELLSAPAGLAKHFVLRQLQPASQSPAAAAVVAVVIAAVVVVMVAAAAQRANNNSNHHLIRSEYHLHRCLYSSHGGRLTCSYMYVTLYCAGAMVLSFKFTCERTHMQPVSNQVMMSTLLTPGQHVELTLPC